MTINDIIHHYYEGNITLIEASQRVIQQITPENVAAAVELLRCNNSIFEAVRKDVERLPTDDEGWSRLLTLHSWNATTQEAIERIKEADRRDRLDLRRGVETLRKSLIYASS